MEIKTYTPNIIRNRILYAITAGQSNDDVRDLFLKMKMTNDLEGNSPVSFRPPTLVEIYEHLIGNGVIADNEIEYDKNIFNRRYTERLNIKLSAICQLHIVWTDLSLQITINESNSMYIPHYHAADTIKWIIRQKQHLDKYLQEWEELFKESTKRAKGEHMAFLAIKAIFTEAMRDYPKLKYEIVEQQRKARIKVEIPNSNLGVCIDGWWKSYQQRLPQQIESLKLLIDTHRNSAIKTFFTTRYIH